jgi:hypothetical protein
MAFGSLGLDSLSTASSSFYSALEKKVGQSRDYLKEGE